MSSPKYFHVGMQKCGSTKIQSYFASHKDINLISEKNPIRLLIANAPLITYNETKSREAFCHQINQRQIPNQLTVISAEAFSGTFYSGHFAAMNVADRIKGFVPDSRIILSLREQRSLLSSIYRWYVRKGGTLSCRDFLTQKHSMRCPSFTWQAYQFHHLVEKYFELFGSENVLVLLMDDLTHKPEDFFNAINEFMGIESVLDFSTNQRVNVGSPAEFTERDRLLNLFSPPQTTHHFSDRSLLQNNIIKVVVKPFIWALTPIISQRRDTVRQVINQEFSTCYQESNRKLEGLIDRELTQLGWQ